jgi:hypothetical protein
MKGLVIGIVGGTTKQRKRLAGRIAVFDRGTRVIIVTHHDLNSRRSMYRENIRGTERLWKVLKKGSSIIWVAPLAKMIDKRIRNLTDVGIAI